VRDHGRDPPVRPQGRIPAPAQPVHEDPVHHPCHHHGHHCDGHHLPHPHGGSPPGVRGVRRDAQGIPQPAQADSRHERPLHPHYGNHDAQRGDAPVPDPAGDSVHWRTYPDHDRGAPDRRGPHAPVHDPDLCLPALPGLNAATGYCPCHGEGSYPDRLHPDVHHRAPLHPHPPDRGPADSRGAAGAGLQPGDRVHRKDPERLPHCHSIGIQCPAPLQCARAHDRYAGIPDRKKDACPRARL